MGKYRIVELIGHGGMASVFRGIDEDLERGVAIKVLHPHLEHRQEAKERFRREAKAIAKISHPNIVEIYDYSGEDSSQSYIVTQLVSGGNLKDLGESQGPFPPEIAAAIALQVAEGLAVAHSTGVVHRDIKPENLLLDKDGTVKVADFGIAHLTDAHDMTATGQILGSPFYMSPEQVLGGPLDERADIFSFGSLLFWLATGKPAFDGPNPHAILHNIVEKDVEEVDRLAPAIGRKMGDLIHACLMKTPQERFSSLGPIITALQRYLEVSAVEDVRRELREFIASPEKYRSERKAKSIAAWSEKAQKLEQEGAVQEAMDLYNRVLALDQENPQVLGRMKKVRSAQSRRRAARWAVSAAALFSVLAAAFWVGMALFSEPPGAGKTEPGQSPGKIVPPWSEISSYNVAPGSESPPGQLQGGPSKKNGKDGGAGKKVKGHAVAFNAATIKTGAGGKMREVKFVPKPKTVNIYIDGKLYGRYFDHQQALLAVGEHLIRFEPQDTECCEAVEKKVTVQPPQGESDKPQLIGMSLTFRPASLVVFSDKPGDVLVDGTKMGRTGEFIDVDVGNNVSKNVEVGVKAGGCEPWSTKLQLRAGKKSTLKAALVCM